MSRVIVVPKSRKAQKCDRCGKALPVGSTYRWTKPRYGSQKTRCMEDSCRFRPSDLSGAKTAQIHDAIEDAERLIADATNTADMKSALEDVGQVAQDVADEYQEANDNWTANGASENDEWSDLQQQCEDFASECTDWEPDEELDEDEDVELDEELEREEDEDEPTFLKRLAQAIEEKREELLEDARSSAQDVLSNFGA